MQGFARLACMAYIKLSMIALVMHVQRQVSRRSSKQPVNQSQAPKLV